MRAGLPRRPIRQRYSRPRYGSIMRINLSIATLGIVVGLVDFCFLLSILCMLLILSRLIRATISVFFVPCCPVLLSFYLSYLTCLNLINGDGDGGRRPYTGDRRLLLRPNSITLSGSKLVADLQRAEIWPIIQLANSELARASRSARS